MSVLTRTLFPLPDCRRTPFSLLTWWESRRLTYNLVVGGAGLLTLGTVAIVGLLPPAPPIPGVPWVRLLGGAVVYGVAANLCYSLGWLVELAMRALWGEEAPFAGPALFRQGLSFAVGLTLLPIPLVCVSWVGRLLAHLF